MKWKITKQVKPTIGQTRTEMKWAWLPVRAMSLTENQEYYVWMDWYTRTEEFSQYLFTLPGLRPELVLGWHTIARTVDTREYIRKKW